jgi:DNA-binding transcriptional LysR family regulator
MIDFRWRTFLAVIEEGTLARAGEKLGLTQPAVSQHLKALENYYSQPLFDHKGRSLVLNEAGKLVRITTEKILLGESKLEKELGGLLGGRSRYRLGATLTVGEFILPSFLGEYHQAFPGRELTIQINNTVSILDLLKKGLIDLAVVEGPFDKSTVQYRHFMKDEMIFIGTDRYIKESAKKVDLPILRNSRLILREQGSGTRFYWEEFIKEKKISLPQSTTIMEVGSLSAIKSLVEAGYGSSVMSRKAVEKELLLGSLRTRPFLWGPLTRDLNFIFTEDSPLPFVEEFIDFCGSTK